MAHKQGRAGVDSIFKRRGAPAPVTPFDACPSWGRRPACPPLPFLLAYFPAMSGSAHLRIGLASSDAPLVLPHCVSWRRRAPAAAPASSLATTPIAEPTVTALVEGSLPRLARALHLGKALLGVEHPTVPPWLEPLPHATAATETDPFDDEQALVGERALAAAQLRPEEWELFWPLRRAHLASLYPSTSCGPPPNSEPAPPASRVRDALALIWTSALCGGSGLRGLGLSAAALERSCAVLALPDLFPRHESAEMLEVLFNALGFKAVLCHEEATCACVGAKVPSACVVDVGAQRTSVVCIDELMPMSGCHQARSAPSHRPHVLGPASSAPLPLRHVLGTTFLAHVPSTTPLPPRRWHHAVDTMYLVPRQRSRKLFAAIRPMQSPLRYRRHTVNLWSTRTRVTGARLWRRRS